MAIHDISLLINSKLPTWPNDPKIVLDKLSNITDGQTTNTSRITMCVHTGTHIDAPVHFIEDGIGVDKIPLEKLIGEVLVVELLGIEIITPEDLMDAELPSSVERILIKTKNSEQWLKSNQTFNPDYVGISSNAAEFLLTRGVELVGVDYLSIAPFHDTYSPHQIFLSNGVVLLEGLNLSSIQPGRYNLVCMPLKLDGADGAPARVALMDL